MIEICPHCDSPIPEDCTPEKSPDCWELYRASASPDIHVEAWVTEGDTAVTKKVDRFLGALDDAEARL